MKPFRPKLKPKHTAAEKSYFKSIADMVRQKRLESEKLIDDAKAH